MFQIRAKLNSSIVDVSGKKCSRMEKRECNQAAVITEVKHDVSQAAHSKNNTGKYCTVVKKSPKKTLKKETVVYIILPEYNWKKFQHTRHLHTRSILYIAH